MHKTGQLPSLEMWQGRFGARVREYEPKIDVGGNRATGEVVGLDGLFGGFLICLDRRTAAG